MENKTEKKLKKRKKKRHFRHINQSDRDRIEALLNSGHKQEEIAKILDFDPGAISREINKRKTKDGKYTATVAQHKARIKRKNSKSEGMKVEAYPELRERIIRRIGKQAAPLARRNRRTHGTGRNNSES